MNDCAIGQGNLRSAPGVPGRYQVIIVIRCRFGNKVVVSFRERPIYTPVKKSAILIMELVRAFDGSWRAHIVAVDRFPGAHLLVLQLPSGLI